MKRLKRLTALALALIVAAGALAACGGDAGSSGSTGGGAATPPPVNSRVLVIAAAASFEEKWNPFLVESAYDHEVVDQIFAPVMRLAADGSLVPEAGDLTYEVQADGGVLYTVKLKEGMTFSDGTPVTIDDYIYGIYVRADPSNTSPINLADSYIEGASEYFYDDPNYTEAIQGFEAECEKYLTANVTWEDFYAYMVETGYAEADASVYLDYNLSVAQDFPQYLDAMLAIEGLDLSFVDMSAEGWYTAIYAEGNEDAAEAYDAALEALVFTPEQAVALYEVYSQIEYDIYREYYDVYNHHLQPMKDAYVTGNLEDGIDVPEISGITRVDDLTCTVRYYRPNFVADRELTTNNGMGNLVPRHYYGELKKGDVSQILANMEPMGSGPYLWDGFADNIATCNANPNYFRGVPKTGIVRWQYVPDNEIVEKLAAGEVDIAEPSGSESTLDALNGAGITYNKTDNAGYGYLGMNCENMPLEVRRGMWYLLNRAPSVEGYYGSGADALAQIIERPSSTVVPEYPKDATEYYGYDPEKAAEQFALAGYTLNGAGELVNAAGEKLVLSVYVGGEGIGYHPGYAMLTQAAEDLAALGGELQIQDVTFSVLQAGWNSGEADMVVMAWSAVYDCDKTPQFHTTGGQNKYRFSDPAMDQMLETITQTLDFEERVPLVAEMLDYAMEMCIEFPLYQRYNLQAYHVENLNMDTVPAPTPFADYKAALWQVEMAV